MKLEMFDRCIGFVMVVLLALYVAQAVELIHFRQQVAGVGESTQQVVERRVELLNSPHKACPDNGAEKAALAIC